VWHIDAYNRTGRMIRCGNFGIPSYLEANGFKGVPAIFIDQYTLLLCNIGTDPYGNYRWAKNRTVIGHRRQRTWPNDIKFGFDGRISPD